MTDSDSMKEEAPLLSDDVLDTQTAGPEDIAEKPTQQPMFTPATSAQPYVPPMQNQSMFAAVPYESPIVSQAVFTPAKPYVPPSEHPDTIHSENTAYRRAPGAVQPFPKREFRFRPLSPLPPDRIGHQPPENDAFQPPKYEYQQQQDAYQPLQPPLPPGAHGMIPVSQPGQGVYQPAPQLPYASQQQQTVVTAQPHLQQAAPGRRPYTFLYLSLFSCFCCIWPLGLAALIVGHQVDTSWESGDQEGAKRQSRIALVLNILSILGGIGLYIGMGVYFYNKLYSY